MQDRQIEAYIGVASNIDPEANILRALEMLRTSVPVTATSTFYRTPAINRPEQPAYLDGVWRIETALPPRELKSELLRPIEAKLGRVRTQDKYAARTIDLDVLVYGQIVRSDPDCRIPAPEIRGRAFLVAALLELAPDLVLPDTNEPLASLAMPEEIAELEPAAQFTATLRSRLGLSNRR